METIYGVIIYFVVLFGMGFIVYKVGSYQTKKFNDELRFDIMHLNLQTIIESWTVNEKNYYQILEHIGEIQRLKYQNKEKIDVLKTEFKRRYDVISKNILAEADEFAPENIFYDLEN